MNLNMDIAERPYVSDQLTKKVGQKNNDLPYIEFNEEDKGILSRVAVMLCGKQSKSSLKS